jgi:hypothetical protein
MVSLTPELQRQALSIQSSFHLLQQGYTCQQPAHYCLIYMAILGLEHTYVIAGVVQTYIRIRYSLANHGWRFGRKVFE